MRLIPLSSVFALLFFLSLPSLPAQEIKTALTFFNEVADRYEGINDYTADVSINIDGTVMRGALSYKRPDRIRIDFSQPEEQVIVSDGNILKVYIPRYNVTLTQNVRTGGSAAGAGAGVASQEGLALLRRGFNIAYKVGPNPIPLDEGVSGGSTEQVIKLLLTWKNTNQGFRQIELSLSANKLIRRIEGLSADRKRVRIDYSNIEYNQGVPTTRFEYDSPASANNYDSFLFGTN